MGSIPVDGHSGSSIRNFPMWLFIMHSHKTQGYSAEPPLTGLPGQMGDYPWGKELRHNSWLMGLCGVISYSERSNQRARGMKTFCEMCGYKSTESQISRFLLHTFPCLKALEISLANVKILVLLSAIVASANKNNDEPKDSMDVDSGRNSNQESQTSPTSYRFIEEVSESSASLVCFCNRVLVTLFTRCLPYGCQTLLRSSLFGWHTLRPSLETMHWSVNDLVSTPPRVIELLQIL